MKKRLLPLTAACAVLVTGGIQAKADRVPLAQVPETVQKAIREQSKGETVQEVERETRDGTTVYEAEFKREGINRRVKFAADGSIVTENRGFADVTTSATINALPVPVQKTLEEQRAGRIVADIDKETWNGQTVYEVEFQDKGPNSRIHIASDGSLVMNKQARASYLGMQLSETPKPIQDTVKGMVGDAEIADVDVKTKEGKVVYNVEIRQEGLNRHLQIAENGALLRDSKMIGTAEAIGTRVRDAGERVRDAGERVREKITDRDAPAVSFNQLPNAVQKTINANGGDANVKSIKQELKDGTVRYAVEFEQGGKNTRLKIAPDGTILEDNRK